MQKMSRVVQTPDDLEEHLRDHVSFLKASSDAFDTGNTGEANSCFTARDVPRYKKLAFAIRSAKQVIRKLYFHRAPVRPREPVYAWWPNHNRDVGSGHHLLCATG